MVHGICNVMVLYRSLIQSIHCMVVHWQSLKTRAVNWDSRQGLAGPGWTRESESSLQRTRGLARELRFSIGLASPRVPASPRKASPRVQTDGLVPALLKTLIDTGSQLARFRFVGPCFSTNLLQPHFPRNRFVFYEPVRLIVGSLYFRILSCTSYWTTFSVQLPMPI